MSDPAYDFFKKWGVPLNPYEGDTIEISMDDDPLTFRQKSDAILSRMYGAYKPPAGATIVEIQDLRIPIGPTDI